MSAQQPAPGPPKIAVLIVTGQNGHDWRGTTPLLRKALEDTDKFEVRVTEEFRGAGPETLAPYDVVVLNYFERGRKELRWGDKTDNAFLDFKAFGQGPGRLPLLDGGVRWLDRVREDVGRQLETEQRPPFSAPHLHGRYQGHGASDHERAEALVPSNE
jgi:hypothetical protein